MYVAVIDIRMEVHPEKDGKCTGAVLKEQELNNFNLKNNMLVRIEGATKNDCLTKLRSWMQDAGK